MGSIGQGHKREKRPVIVSGRVGALFSAKPCFYLRPSRRSSAFGYYLWQGKIYLAWWKPTTHTSGGGGGDWGETVITCYPDLGRVDDCSHWPWAIIERRGESDTTCSVLAKRKCPLRLKRERLLSPRHVKSPAVLPPALIQPSNDDDHV